MVTRYNQPQLPSLVVGTPGLDQSAGVAAAAVAKASNTAVSENLQTADRMGDQAKGLEQQAQNSYGQAQQSFGRSISESVQAVGDAQRQARYQAEQAAQQRSLQNSLLASNAKLGQQAQVDTAVAQYKAQFSGDPYAAPDAFTKTGVPTLQKSLLGQYTDPYTQRTMIPQVNTMLEAARGDLQSWAPKAVTEKVQGQLDLIPKQITEMVGNIDPTKSVVDQLSTYHKIMATGLDPYQTLKTQSALIPGKGDQIDAAATELKQVASKQFAQNGISSISDDATGLVQYRQWQQVLEHPEISGLQLKGEDRSALLSQLNAQKNTSVKSQTDSIQSDSQISLANIKVQQVQLAENFQNPQVRDQITTAMHDTLADLQSQLKQTQGQPAAPGSPEETIKKAKLLSIDQQLGQLLGGEKQSLNETNGFEALQRTMQTFAHSQVTFAQGQQKFLQGQTSFQEGQTKFVQGQTDRDTKTAHTAAVNVYNQQMQPLIEQQNTVLGMPIGGDRLKAAQDHAKQLTDVADSAFKSGAISANQYGAIQKQATDLIQKSEFKMNGGILGFGAGPQAPKTPADKAQATLDANQKMTQVSKLGQQNISNVQTLIKMSGNYTSDPNEAALVTKFLLTHGQAGLDKMRSKVTSPQQLDQAMPGYLRNIIDQVRKGQIH